MKGECSWPQHQTTSVNICSVGVQVDWLADSVLVTH